MKSKIDFISQQTSKARTHMSGTQPKMKTMSTLIQESDGIPKKSVRGTGGGGKEQDLRKRGREF